MLPISNTELCEVLYPLGPYASGLVEPLDVRDGHIYVPTPPGIGAVYDWAAIDEATVERLTFDVNDQ